MLTRPNETKEMSSFSDRVRLDDLSCPSSHANTILIQGSMTAATTTPHNKKRLPQIVALHSSQTLIHEKEERTELYRYHLRLVAKYT
jgi:hypothetical protein